MKYSDLLHKKVDELIKEKGILTAQLFEMKMKNSVGQCPQPNHIRQLRKDLARLNTILVKKAGE